MSSNLEKSTSQLSKMLRKHVASDGTAHHYRRGQGNAYQPVGREAAGPGAIPGNRNRPTAEDQVTQDDDNLEVPLPYKVSVSDDSERSPAP